MPKRMIATLCLASLTACASPYGNYANVTDSYNVQMADDSVHKLTALYPPAATHLSLLQATQDAYGVELVKKLRENGYGLEEGHHLDDFFSSPVSEQTGNHTELPTAFSATVLQKPTVTADASGSILTIGYIVDHLGGGFYRVTISIDGKALSRVYKVSGNGIAPAGAWTRKE